MEQDIYGNRDLSWLSFNNRVLEEAGKETVPLLERIKFLSIYSSNLDEFYRVRIPVLMTLSQRTAKDLIDVYQVAAAEINRQQQQFGKIIQEEILPALEKQKVFWIYNKEIPASIEDAVSALFYNEVLAHIYSVDIDDDLSAFFAENNKLYQAVVLIDPGGNERIKLIHTPSDVIQRLYSIKSHGSNYILFLEDIIERNVAYLFPNDRIMDVFNLKITRDAALDIDPNYKGDITDAVERQLERRDLGFATRFLAQPGIALRTLYYMVYRMDLERASIVEGGHYHNLKDLVDFPLSGVDFVYPKWEPIVSINLQPDKSLFDTIFQGDLLINVPYQSYDPILRFFNEAANDQSVTEIYTTLYRVASNSRIVSALITAARNRKKVVVMVELKARFDEANNIKWAKQMKNAGVNIVYSSLDLKVHAKVALVKKVTGSGKVFLGLFATGNLNENTAKFYTDHVLLTARQSMLEELDLLFSFLAKPKTAVGNEVVFKELMVAQFNLHHAFLSLIQREIDNANAGLNASITIKLNNLEEQVLINKLYEASAAGVKVTLIVRGICCLIPGMKGISENITVKRIVDRYLEHGRIFIFHNNNDPQYFMGSADWMNRNIYSRIEVCFPLHAKHVKDTIQDIIDLQLKENEQQSVYLYLEKLNSL
ncbi:polyphosphate kinase 1 [Pedobacter sp. PWIIR3]